jgi:hypothetical protein
MTYPSTDLRTLPIKKEKSKTASIVSIGGNRSEEYSLFIY